VNRLWYAGSLFAFAIAVSAVYGIINTMVRGWPDQFTTDNR